MEVEFCEDIKFCEVVKFSEDVQFLRCDPTASPKIGYLCTLC